MLTLTIAIAVAADIHPKILWQGYNAKLKGKIVIAIN